jgi:hypothetical protein
MKTVIVPDSYFLLISRKVVRADYLILIGAARRVLQHILAFVRFFFFAARFHFRAGQSNRMKFTAAKMESHRCVRSGKQRDNQQKYGGYLLHYTNNIRRQR